MAEDSRVDSWVQATPVEVGASGATFPMQNAAGDERQYAFNELERALVTNFTGKSAAVVIEGNGTLDPRVAAATYNIVPIVTRESIGIYNLIIRGIISID